ncbi:cytochrome P450 [Penicillium digitatum]|uniref:Cytochrome P450 n=1 Tax=Penicillium digitatum TaxID=36651 RepID=A0A7T6XM28_PENDI|nr:cytochrome P450 [Penicillium digitatum]
MALRIGKYIIGVNRGLLSPGTDETAKLEKVSSSMSSISKKNKLRRHFRRFWCLYLIANVIFLSIFLPVFFLVAIPAIAQLVVNKSDLRIVNAEVMHPTAETVRMTLEAKVNLKLALGVRLDPVVFYTFVRSAGYKNAYAGIKIPGQTIKGNYSLGVMDQLTPILNVTSWETFVSQAVLQKETALSLYGATTGYLGVLKNHFVLDKDVTMPGEFAGFSVANSTFLLPAEDDGSNLVANITLPNPSVLSFEVGTITLDLKSGHTDLVIGKATVKGVTLRPGNNTFPLTGVIDIGTMIGNLTEVLSSQGPAIRRGALSLTAVTRSIVSNGTLIPYYTKALASLPLVANVSIGDVLRNSLAHLGSSETMSERDEKRKRGPVQLDGPVGYGDLYSQVASLKHNRHVQKIFEDEDPKRRDAMIDSLARYYAAL